MWLPCGHGGHQRLEAMRKCGMGGKGPSVHRLDRCKPHALGSGRAAFGKNSCSPLIW